MMTTGTAEEYVTTRSCEHSSCPAPAVRVVDIHGQDFHFCNHHAVEVEEAVAWTELPGRDEQQRPREQETAVAG